MIHFVVAMGAPGSCADLGDRLAAAVRDTTLIGGDVVAVVSPSGTWRFAAVADPDPFLAVRWDADGERLMVTNGCVVGRDQPLSLPATRQRFERDGFEAARESLRGTFNLVGVSPERGLVMGGDSGGCFPLYYGTGPDLFVVSNRSTTVAQVLGREGWNVPVLGWLVGMSLIAGEEVPARGVRVLPVARVARVRWGGTEVLVEPGSHPSLVAAGTDPARTSLTAAEWDQVTDDLVAEMRGLARVDAPMALPITGGKDSRLVLALAKAAGVRDLVTFTSGGVDDPEVICSRGIAQALGFDHRGDVPDEVRRRPTRTEVVGPGPEPPLATPPWHRVARANGRYEGIVSAWAGWKTPIAPASVIIKGWGGENYRFRGRMVPDADRFYDSHVPAASGAGILAGWYAERVDPLRLLVPDERARQISWLRDRVHGAARDLRLDLIPDDLWLAHRANQYQGPILQGTPMRHIANPLVSAGALRRYSELSLAVRRTDRLHYEVMRRTAPELVAIPFFEQRWSPEIEASSPFAPFARGGSWGRRVDRVIADVGCSLRSSPERQRGEAFARRTERWARVDLVGGTRWSTARPSGNEPAWTVMGSDREAIVSMVREAAGVGLSSLCDIDRIATLIRRPPRLTRREELQLLDAIFVAHLLLGRTERVVDTR